MDISRELAIKILKYLDKHREFYFPFTIINREYAKDDDDFIEIEPNEWQTISGGAKYHIFQLRENLQNLSEETLQLMVKGFLEKIINNLS